MSVTLGIKAVKFLASNPWAIKASSSRCSSVAADEESSGTTPLANPCEGRNFPRPCGLMPYIECADSLLLSSLRSVGLPPRAWSSTHTYHTHTHRLHQPLHTGNFYTKGLSHTNTVGKAFWITRGALNKSHTWPVSPANRNNLLIVTQLRYTDSLPGG